METQRNATDFIPVTAIGLMSGTSKDGVDVVRLVTDGAGVLHEIQHHAHPYPRELYERMKYVGLHDIPLNDVLRLERDVTEQYVEAIVGSGFLNGSVTIIGCHGQTVRHLPQEGLTWQLGNPNLLAQRLYDLTGHSPRVVSDFRRRDMAAGGEGAPLIPLFHAAMLAAHGATLPAAILNIGGVANVSIVNSPTEIHAADCGPGMGLLDQFIQARTGAAFDEDGALSLQGTPDLALIQRAMTEIAFFQRPFPRSADRYEFNVLLEWLAQHSTPDGAATLAALTVAGIDDCLRQLGTSPEKLNAIYLAGGGGRNAAVWQGLKSKGWPLKKSEDMNWPPLAVEAACFAWLAVRHLRKLPFTLATTTGCRMPTVGGVITAGA